MTTITQRIFSITAGLFLLAAFVMLWRNNISAAFVIATLGVVAWFLGYRSQLRANIATETALNENEDIDEE